MSFPAPPMKLEQWTIAILDELVKHPEVENETLDFKEKKMGDLAHDICAMANMSGGVLVLGINQERSGRSIERFRKNGFDKGEEDSINR